ncbi:MAG: hypothetical protein LPD71_15710, partial [Shewanella sp.]|nr:hypothetical protein [Shewanella sp.]
VEQLHHNRVALYKTTTKCCKNHLQRSTDPSAVFAANCIEFTCNSPAIDPQIRLAINKNRRLAGELNTDFR